MKNKISRKQEIPSAKTNDIDQGIALVFDDNPAGNGEKILKHNRIFSLD